MKGNYEIKIEAINTESGELLRSWAIQNGEEIESVSKNIKQVLKNYDLKNFKECQQCMKSFHIEELSEPNDPDFKGVLFCQECLEELLRGTKKLGL